MGNNLGVTVVWAIILIILISIVFFAVTTRGITKTAMKVYLGGIGIAVIVVFFGYFVERAEYNNKIETKEERESIKVFLEEAEVLEEHNLNKVELIDIPTERFKSDKINANVWFVKDGDMVVETTEGEGSVHFLEDVEEPYVTYYVFDKEMSDRYAKGDVYGLNLYLPKNYQIEAKKQESSSWVVPIFYRR